jgi:hypothetical protein
MLAAMYEQLLEILPLRPTAVVVRSEPEAVEATYASLTQALLQSENEEPAETVLGCRPTSGRGPTASRRILAMPFRGSRQVPMGS